VVAGERQPEALRQLLKFKLVAQVNRLVVRRFARPNPPRNGGGGGRQGEQKAGDHRSGGNGKGGSATHGKCVKRARSRARITSNATREKIFSQTPRFPGFPPAFPGGGRPAQSSTRMPAEA